VWLCFAPSPQSLAPSPKPRIRQCHTPQRQREAHQRPQPSTPWPNCCSGTSVQRATSASTRRCYRVPWRRVILSRPAVEPAPARSIPACLPEQLLLWIARGRSPCPPWRGDGGGTASCGARTPSRSPRTLPSGGALRPPRRGGVSPLCAGAGDGEVSACGWMPERRGAPSVMSAEPERAWRTERQYVTRSDRRSTRRGSRPVHGGHGTRCRDSTIRPRRVSTGGSHRGRKLTRRGTVRPTAGRPSEGQGDPGRWPAPPRPGPAGAGWLRNRG